jgi:predicted Fe-Mo cluster-binding NifX family protein
MNEKLIRFAYAVNHADHFETKHFGEADKYLIYEWGNNEFIFLKEESNRFKNFDEEQAHGSQKKGRQIIEFLQKEGVQVLVSRQFGKNIQMVNQDFIPVIVYDETPREVMYVLKKHIKWIQDELENRPEKFKLFTIKNGVLKTIIKKEE